MKPSATTSNGALSLIRTLVHNHVTVCFSNPGTSEMHFVAALDSVTDMKAVLCLFEGVCTGAADAYARMTGKPAATLLHLGPGMANGIANLHNARRAQSAMINIVGDHASFHLAYDAPLTSDIEGLARTFSGWVKSAASAKTISQDTATAIEHSLRYQGQIATLILPADTAWTPSDNTISQAQRPPEEAVDQGAISHVAEVLRGAESCLLMVAGQAAINEGLTLVSRIANHSGAELMSNRPTARRQLGAGRPQMRTLAYPIPQALEQLKSFAHIVLIGTKEPVGFFGYPDTPSRLAPEGCQLHTLVSPTGNVVATLQALADELQVSSELSSCYSLELPVLPEGNLTLDKVWQSIAAQLPDNAIVINEAITSATSSAGLLQHSRPHDVLHGTGGAIGHGLPQAVGAAIACPDRKVVCLQADGSAMYTIQALWTQARENLDITTILFNNRAYKILQGELDRVGAERSGKIADSLLMLDTPTLNFVSLAQGMGVEAEVATTAEHFNQLLAYGLAKKGPFLIEVIL